MHDLGIVHGNIKGVRRRPIHQAVFLLSRLRHYEIFAALGLYDCAYAVLTGKRYHQPDGSRSPDRVRIGPDRVQS